VDSWERFRQQRTALFATGSFRESKIEHGIYLKALTLAEEIPVDIIPFGGVAEADVIHWSPARETAMTVAGFEVTNKQLSISADYGIVPLQCRSSIQCGR
jgi:predicted nucleotidyltransferase